MRTGLVASLLTVASFPLACGDDNAGSAGVASSACGQRDSTDWYEPYEVVAEDGQQITTLRATVDVDAQEREYILELPEPYDPDELYPLAFYFHGNGGSMDRIFRTERLSDAFGNQAIVAYPQGLPGEDSESTWDLSADGPDASLFGAMVDQIGSELCVDTRRIVTLGFSRGANLSHTLACDGGDVVAGSSPAAGGLLRDTGSCAGPVPQFLVHGDQDTGNTSIEVGRQARDAWLSINGCSDETSDAGSPDCVRYDDCSSDMPVVWCEIPGAGHGSHASLGKRDAAVAFLRSLNGR